MISLSLLQRKVGTFLRTCMDYLTIMLVLGAYYVTSQTWCWHARFAFYLTKEHATYEQVKQCQTEVNMVRLERGQKLRCGDRCFVLCFRQRF